MIQARGDTGKKTRQKAKYIMVVTVQQLEKKKYKTWKIVKKHFLKHYELAKIIGSLENNLRLEYSLWWFLIRISISLSVGANETWNLVSLSFLWSRTLWRLSIWRIFPLPNTPLHLKSFETSTLFKLWPNQKKKKKGIIKNHTRGNIKKKR